MTDIVLRELSNSDIDWMATTGLKLELAAGDLLLETGSAVNTMYLILDGSLVLMAPSSQGDREISILSSGDILGTSFLLNTYALPFTVRARGKTLVLAIPQQQLQEKLDQDVQFSARFYRAIAILLYDRQRQISAKLPKAFVAQSLFQKSIFAVFSCLNDSDLCWLSNQGHVEKLDAGNFCMHEGKPLDALYIMLRGNLAIFVCEQERKALALAFGVNSVPNSKQVAEILPGEIIGVTQFLGLGPNPYSMQASADSLVLAIPLPLLNLKLQEDLGFATRFYRALASLTMERIYQILMRLHDEQGGMAAPSASVEEDELSMDALQQMSVARAKFNWLLQYLNVKV